MFHRVGSCRTTLAFASWASAAGVAPAGGESTGLVPITELPPALYQGFPGGLYPGESNMPPPVHAAAAQAQALQIIPRDAAGNPNLDTGRIYIISIGMSNTTHEFSPFERGADLNIGRNAGLVIVNTALGGQSASVIADPAAPYWSGVAGKVAAAGGTNAQVQVAWLKEANAGPTDPFPMHAQALRDDLKQIARNLRALFPNLRIVYLSSRVYGGYSTGPLNPEPYAYESAFSVKWAIEDQINGDATVNWNPDVGPVVAPLMLWGPYLWADGLMPRADGLIWERADFEADGTHPAPSGEVKVGQMLLEFFTEGPAAGPWYPARPGQTLRHVNADADATVDASAPDANFGAMAQLLASGGAVPRRIYLRFDVSGLPRPVRFAKLSLRVSTTGGGGGPVRIAPDSAWDEATITWNNAPLPAGDALANAPGSSRDGTYAADVTAAVNADADGVLTFVLSPPGGGQTSYISKEGGQPPRLILTVNVPPDCFGNANFDGVINFADLTSVLVNFGNEYPAGAGPGDADHNGIVNFADVSAVLANFGNLCP